MSDRTNERCAAQDLLADARLEMELRREWWMNHGHDFYALYGDDGEMQCASCPADFKRDPLDRLRELVTAGRLARAALTVSAADQEQVKEALEKAASLPTWNRPMVEAKLAALHALALLGSNKEKER